MSRRSMVALALAAVAVLAAGCGGGPTHGVASIGSETSTTRAAASPGRPSPGDIGSKLAKYTLCMRSHGVAGFPSPVVSGNSVSLRLTPAVSGSPHFHTAQSACQHLLPGRPTSANFTTQQQADYLKAANCMRAHGIAGFPDPVFSGGQVSFPLPHGMNANSTPFLRAREICQKLIPQGLPYSS